MILREKISTRKSNPLSLAASRSQNEGKTENPHLGCLLVFALRRWQIQLRQKFSGLRLAWKKCPPFERKRCREFLEWAMTWWMDESMSDACMSFKNCRFVRAMRRRANLCSFPKAACRPRKVMKLIPRGWIETDGI